jgi:hypothetical protein
MRFQASLPWPELASVAMLASSERFEPFVVGSCFGESVLEWFSGWRRVAEGLVSATVV